MRAAFEDRTISVKIEASHQIDAEMKIAMMAQPSEGLGLINRPSDETRIAKLMTIAITPRMPGRAAVDINPRYRAIRRSR